MGGKGRLLMSQQATPRQGTGRAHPDFWQTAFSFCSSQWTLAGVDIGLCAPWTPERGAVHPTNG